MVLDIRHGKGRFFIITNSGEAELLYDLDKKDKIMSIYHTFVPDAERGKGIAEELAVKAFELAKRNGVLVKPDCEYIRHFILKHKELENMITYKK